MFEKGEVAKWTFRYEERLSLAKTIYLLAL